MDEIHTPGPWEVDGMEIYPVAGHRACDAICEMKPGFSQADAQLIAASPLLLSSCQELLNMLEQMNLPAGFAVERARIAIARATGAA